MVFDDGKGGFIGIINDCYFSINSKNGNHTKVKASHKIEIERGGKKYICYYLHAKDLGALIYYCDTLVLEILNDFIGDPMNEVIQEIKKYYSVNNYKISKIK